MGIMEGILAGGQGIAAGINTLGQKIEDQIAKEQFRKHLLSSGLMQGQTQPVTPADAGAVTLATIGQNRPEQPAQPAAQPIPSIGGAGGAIPAMAGGSDKFGQGFANDFQNKWAASKPGIGGGAIPSMAYAPAPAAAPQAVSVPQSLIATESGGRWNASNNVARNDGTVGHFGRLQFSQPRLAEAVSAGVLPAGITPQQFMASPQLQQATEAWHFADIDKFIQQKGFDKAIGSTINGVPVTLDGMRAVAHLGGKTGLERFMETGGRYNPADANGTSLMSYLATHQGQSQTNPLARVPPMNTGGENAPQGTPMTLGALGAAPGTSQPQQAPQFNLAMLADLATNKYGAPIAAAILQKQLGRDPMQAQLMMAQLEGAKLANEAKRREIAGEGSRMSYQDLGNDIAVLNAKGEIVRTIPKSRAPVALGEGQRLIDPNSGKVLAGGDTTPKITEGQGKDLGFYTRGRGANETFSKFEDVLANSTEAARANIPLVGNFAASSKYQTAQQAGREVLAAILRKDTGAAITQQEMDVYGKMYLPQPGDSKDVILQKREARSRALEAIRLGLGKAEALIPKMQSQKPSGTTSSGLKWSIE